MKTVLEKDKIKYANMIGRLNNKRLHNTIYTAGDFFMLISEGMLIPSDENPETLIKDLKVYCQTFPEIKELIFAGVPIEQFKRISKWAPVLWEERCYLYAYEEHSQQVISKEYREYQLDCLNKEDAAIVFNYYGYKDDGIEYILNTIEYEKTFCARFEGKPVSWVVQREDGSMGIMYTLQEHRGKGIADWLCKHLIKSIVEAGELPYLHIRVENNASIRLASGLNFKRVGEIVWFGIENPMGV